MPPTHFDFCARAEYKKRAKALDKYDRSSKVVTKQVLSLGNEFYLTHKYDKRGRSYSQGYHINYQGNAWNKAVVCLADKEFVT
jgi:DNA-directed RNA polymerase